MDYKELRKALEGIKKDGLDHPYKLDADLVKLAYNNKDSYEKLMEEFPEILENNDFMNPEEIGIKTFAAPYQGYGEIFNYVKPLLKAHGRTFSEEELQEMVDSAFQVHRNHATDEEDFQLTANWLKTDVGVELSEVGSLFKW